MLWLLRYKRFQEPNSYTDESEDLRNTIKHKEIDATPGLGRSLCANSQNLVGYTKRKKPKPSCTCTIPKLVPKFF